MTKKRHGGYRTKATKNRERKRLQRNAANHRNVSEHPSTEPVSEYTAKPLSSAHCTSPASSKMAVHQTSTFAAPFSCVEQQSQAINTVPALSSALSYHPLALVSTVGDNSTEITDDVIVAGLELIKASGDSESVEYFGYYKPAETQFLTLHPCGRNSTLLPINKDSLHVHPSTRHWVTSYFNSNAGQLFVYDSLKSTAHLQEVTLQLRQMYSNEIVDNLIYGSVTQQSVDPICGVMALAFAFTCFLGVIPINMNFDITKAREHLKTCFESGNISQFPLVLERNESSWIYTYLENQRRLSSQHVSEKRTKKLDSSILSKFIIVQDKQKYKKLSSNTAKCYQTQQTEPLSTQESDCSKAKDRYRKCEQRKLLTPEQRQIIKSKDRYCQAQKRKLLSPEQRDTSKSKDKLRKGDQRKLLSPEQRQTTKCKDKLRKGDQRKLLSPEQRHTIKSKDKLRKRDQRKLLSPEQSDTSKSKDKLRKGDQRKLLSPEQREATKCKDKLRKADQRKLLSPEQRETTKCKDKLRKADQRKLLSPEQRHTIKSKDKLRKSDERKLLSPLQSDTSKSKDKLRKGNQRQLLSPGQRHAIKSKDKLHKRDQRKLLSPEQRHTIKSKDKLHKRDQGKLLSPEQRETSKCKDKLRKCEKKKTFL